LQQICGDAGESLFDLVDPAGIGRGAGAGGIGVGSQPGCDGRSFANQPPESAPPVRRTSSPRSAPTRARNRNRKRNRNDRVRNTRPPCLLGRRLPRTAQIRWEAQTRAHPTRKHSSKVRSGSRRWPQPKPRVILATPISPPCRPPRPDTCRPGDRAPLIIAIGTFSPTASPTRRTPQPDHQTTKPMTVSATGAPARPPDTPSSRQSTRTLDEQNLWDYVLLNPFNIEGRIN
jgi:hypothetical protein